MAQKLIKYTQLTINKSDIGLGSVDNTTDTAKPVSTATSTALNLKAPLASPTFTGTVTGVTKAMVGLTNTDNTSDATKNAAAATLTNKRLAPRINTVASTATLTIDADTTDHQRVTALAEALTIAAPIGTLVDGQRLIIRIKDNGIARTLTFNAIFRFVGTVMLVSTVISKLLYLGAIYNATDAKWDVVAVSLEA